MLLGVAAASELVRNWIAAEHLKDFDFAMTITLQQERVWCAGACRFWGFYVAEGAAALAIHLLECSRLPVVFDLDETLLVAYSLHTLENRLASAERAR